MYGFYNNFQSILNRKSKNKKIWYVVVSKYIINKISDEPAQKNYDPPPLYSSSTLHVIISMWIPLAGWHTGLGPNVWSEGKKNNLYLGHKIG